MALESIDSKMLKNMFIAGAKYLESKKKYVDELNVFPVPDGDTGTNMTLTILAAAKEVQSVDENSMAQVAKAISSGSLRGARGNSGVILSQLFRGFAKEIGEYEQLDTMIIANAFQKGTDTAYKAVMKPKEGTILTVARAIADKASQMSEDTDDILFVLKETLNHAEAVLAKTPDMLPVLKEAGVVDAGGQGLIYVLYGAYLALQNNGELTFEIEETVENEVNLIRQHVSADIEFGYCTEFIINVHPSKVNDSEQEALDIRDYLETIGDSIVAVADEDIIKIHVHTNDPGKALQQGLTLGELMNIKIDNMREQHSNIIFEKSEVEQIPKQTEKKETGFVAVSIGSGLSKIFSSLGADYIVEGGQTMNPSTEDILNAIEKVNAAHVFILPNNKNIILAAMQAKDLVENKIIHVIPSKSIPQGITAMINYTQGISPDENEKVMTEHLSDVSTGQLTYAVRDTSINDQTIQQGDILGIGNDEILVVEKDIEQCAKALIHQLINEDSGLVTIYYGQEIEEEKANNLATYIEENYEDCEVEVHYGGQPLYYYLLSIE
ncbi:MAG: dihydroxyacetone kinase [Firmicutes bacterium HGW-Firmicutes-1]|nr:MAG: dihydroxyacetone kinase [Firmicutes bacterium HGW-Firmicutes-1]